MNRFFILTPDGRWKCSRSSDGDGGDGKDVAKLAGLVSSILTYTRSSATTMVDAPSKNDVVGVKNDLNPSGAAAMEARFKSTSSLSLRLDPNTLVTVLSVHKHALVLQTNPKMTGASVPLLRLREIEKILILLFGPPDYWSVGGAAPRLVTEGIEDMIDALLTTSNPSLLIGGVRRVSLPATTSDQLDEILKMMPKKEAEVDEEEANKEEGESKEEGKKKEKKRDKSTLRKSSTSKPHRVALLTHGCRSVLHSRMIMGHLKHIMTLLQLRETKPFEGTTTPIFRTSIATSFSSSSSSSSSRGRKKKPDTLGGSTSGNSGSDQWTMLVVKSIQRGVLVCEFPMSTTPNEIQSYMENLQRSLHLSCSSILPAEEPPVPLHMYVDHETVAFVAYDRKTCTSVCPQLRPAGPKGEAERLWKLFWWFLSASLDVREAQPSLMKISMVEGDIAFYAVRHEVVGGESVDVYVMTAASKSEEAATRMTSRIVEKMNT